jgi:hypothetical protein
MVVRGEKLGGDLQIGQPACWGCSWESLFLRSSGIRATLLGQCERLPRMGTARRKRTSGVRGLAQETYVSCVSSFPCRVYIDLNHRISRI